MNKRVVNRQLDLAVKALEKNGIAKDRRIDKTYRGQISSFGAAVTMGSLPAAIAFFSDKGGSSVDRTLLMKAIYDILKDDGLATAESNLFDYAINGVESERKENVINASIALKLAMNLFELYE